MNQSETTSTAGGGEIDRSDMAHSAAAFTAWVDRQPPKPLSAGVTFRAGWEAALAAPTAKGGTEVPADPLVAYLERQWSWSKETFGPALRTKGIVQHITKELREIEADPHDLAEWVDVIILAMDGFWRHGGKPSDLLPAMQAKQDRNFARTWPDWRTMGEDQAIEHDRSGEASPPPPAGAAGGGSGNLGALSAGATPGPWYVEREPTDGSYGSGEDCHEGYDAFIILTEAEKHYGAPGALFNSHNSTVGCVETESNEDDFSAWDAVAKANAEFVVALVNAYRSGHLVEAPISDLGAQAEPVDEEARELAASERISAAQAAYDYAMADYDPTAPDHEVYLFDAMKTAIAVADLYRDAAIPPPGVETGEGR